MDFPSRDLMARRNFLALSALGGGLAGLGAGAFVHAAPALAGSADSDAPSLMDIYADQDARPDGEPVFWLTRGREYIIKGGTVTPLYDRHIILAARLIPQPDGGFMRPYTEAAFATMPGEADVPRLLTSPISGQRYPNPIMHPARLTLRVSPSGHIEQKVKLEKPKMESVYEGRLALVHSPWGKPLLTCEINAKATSATAVLNLTELGPYEANEDRRSDGFTPASREVIVVRDAPASLTGASAALQIGVHPSRKFASLDELAKVLTPQETQHFAPWFQTWKQLLYDPKNVVLG